MDALEPRLLLAGGVADPDMGTSAPTVVYYVSTTGSDASAQPTDPSTPWRTIQYAATHVPVDGGCTIMIGAGVYAETNGYGYL
ncbi:MAG: LEPR-XLL domain-containing protein, partial [Planctomycetota bacterium]|nr:LEPR-XLL domain-containing protein [Planctomycetota bacterium]